MTGLSLNLDERLQRGLQLVLIRLNVPLNHGRHVHLSIVRLNKEIISLPTVSAGPSVVLEQAKHMFTVKMPRAGSSQKKRSQPK